MNNHVYVDRETNERTRVAWVIGMTLVCMVASLLITYLILAITQSEHLPIIYLIAALAPGIITPLTTWAIIGFMIRIQMLEEMHRRLSTYDDLSGLFTRRAFLERCEALYRLCHRNGQPMAFATLDLDHFKQVNDKFGHGGGDEVIRTFSAAVTQVMRSTDLAGRMGGEEFAIALPGAGLADARQVMERLRADIEQRQIEYNGMRISVTVSIGIACAELAETIPLEDLILRSDAALYEAKRLGRNRLETVVNLQPAAIASAV